MKRIIENYSLLFINGIIIVSILILAMVCNHSVPTLAPASPRHTIIIDPGHGGVDGGSISCTGAYESHINLEIAIRLNDLMHLLGMQTILIRDSDISVYTEGDTIATKKVSDIKERVRIANETPYAIFMSIHQNHYSDSKYWGSQVFYNKQIGAKELAQQIQDALRYSLTPDNHRKIKQSSGVYLMEHINCAGILIECGFLSNPNEEQKLCNSVYQKDLCCVIATATSRYVNT